MMDHSGDTLRELCATELNADLGLAALGLLPDSVFDADTEDERQPEGTAFIVLRWGEVQDSMGATERRALDIWGYTTDKNRTRIESIVRRAAEVLKNLEPQPKLGGFLVQIEAQGIGADLRDDGYDALVVPYHMRSVASGV